MGIPARKPTLVSQPQAAAQAAPVVRRLKRGEILFAEGETSKSMYLIKSGMIRIYKKKGDALVEIETIRSGQILGELAFLDGNPRSASAEALSECELTEISAPAFQSFLAKIPDWVKILLKTVVGRLRTASIRIRQLENTGASLDYKEKDGRKSTSYVYINPTEFLKMASALLLVATRNGKAAASGGVTFKISLLTRYANHVMQVPAAKITSFLDLLVQCKIVKDVNETESTGTLIDVDFLEKAISWMTDENLLEDEKKRALSPKGFLVMGFMVKHLDLSKKDAEGRVTVNLAAIKQKEEGAAQRELFRFDDVDDLVKKGYATTVNIASSSEVTTTVEATSFTLAHRLHILLMTLIATNEQKAKAATK